METDEKWIGEKGVKMKQWKTEVKKGRMIDKEKRIHWAACCHWIVAEYCDYSAAPLIVRGSG